MSIDVAMRRTAADPRVASRMTVSPGSRFATEAAAITAGQPTDARTEDVADPRAGAGRRRRGRPLAGGGRPTPALPVMTNPIVPEVSPPMHEAGQAGVARDGKRLRRLAATANVAPVSSSIRDWS